MAIGLFGDFVNELSGVAIASHERSIRVLLTTPSMSGKGGVSEYWRVLRPYLSKGVQYFTIGSRSENGRNEIAALRILRDSWGFTCRLRRESFDVVHLNPSILPKALIRDGILLLLARSFRKKVLVFAHGWNPAWDSKFPKYLPCLFRVIYGRADAFVVLGSRFERKVRLLGYRKKVFVENAPISDELLFNTEAEGEGQQLASHHVFNILFLARVEKDKGIYEAIDTYRLLKKQHPFVTLTVAGDGSEAISAYKYAVGGGANGISFVGYVEGAEKLSVLSSANAYLFPSHHEGLPLSVLEAMAAGIPVVTTNVGGLEDFFENGVMGFISSSREPEDLAALLTRLIADPELCDKIRQFNRSYAAANFRAYKIALRIEEIYRSVLCTHDEPILQP